MSALLMLAMAVAIAPARVVASEPLGIERAQWLLTRVGFAPAADDIAAFANLDQRAAAGLLHVIAMRGNSQNVERGIGHQSRLPCSSTTFSRTIKRCENVIGHCFKSFARWRFASFDIEKSDIGFKRHVTTNE